MRQEQAEILYNYLIKTEKANADKYSNSTNTSGAPVQINTKTLNYQEDGSNYIVRTNQYDIYRKFITIYN